ncbi:MAG: hypothetical protein JWR80_921 [Bradyrhizobium sp.]|nr:hypothetical protein [Bradyrhizobium sp.]
MSGTPKTRLAVTANGQRSELLSVRELKNGDLVFALKRAPYGDRTAPPKSFYSSAHVSPGIDGHTFTITVELADETRIRNYQQVHRASDPFAHLLWSRRFPNLDHPAFAMKAKASDRVIEIGTFDTNYNNLVIHALVTAPKAIFLATGKWGVVPLRFEHFTVSIVYGFMQLPAYEQGDIVTGDEEGQLLSVPIAEMVDELESAELALTQKLLDRIEDDYARMGRDLPEDLFRYIERHAIFRRPVPFDESDRTSN